MLPLINNTSRNKSSFQLYVNDVVYSLNYKLLDEKQIELGLIEVSNGTMNREVICALIQRVMDFLRKAEMDHICSNDELNEYMINQ